MRRIDRRGDRMPIRIKHLVRETERTIRARLSATPSADDVQKALEAVTAEIGTDRPPSSPPDRKGHGDV